MRRGDGLGGSTRQWASLGGVQSRAARRHRSRSLRRDQGRWGHFRLGALPHGSSITALAHVVCDSLPRTLHLPCYSLNSSPTERPSCARRMTSPKSGATERTVMFGRRFSAGRSVAVVVTVALSAATPASLST